MMWIIILFLQAALPNWVENDNNCTAVNSPAFVVDSGYTGNGTTNYLNTNYNPTTDAVNYALNSNSNKIAFAYIGEGLTTAQISSLTEAIEKYMDAKCPYCGEREKVTWNCVSGSATGTKIWYHECGRCANVFETDYEVKWYKWK